jgi:Uri superfamily endonuclease
MPREISYQLLIDVSQLLWCVIGRLGEFAFPAGRYVYTGSAKQHIDARIAPISARRRRCVGTSTTCSRHPVFASST